MTPVCGYGFRHSLSVVSKIRVNALVAPGRNDHHGIARAVIPGHNKQKSEVDREELA
jgi:hypothetical protein